MKLKISPNSYAKASNNKILIILLLFLTTVNAKEDFVIPQSLLAQVDNGNAEIAYFIATRLFAGTGEFKIDYAKGMVWLKKAANMGYAHAMNDLGYELDADDSEKEALQWFQKAADLGVGKALDKIAEYHLHGKAGLEKNCVIAYEWYRKAEIKEVKIAYNNHAWSLATAANKKCRNPERALRIILELWSIYAKDSLIPWFVWDTKAAVLAAVADFSSAIELQEWIVSEMQKDGLEVTNYQKHLDFYKLRKAWIEQL